jgi:hypothetical protein
VPSARATYSRSRPNARQRAMDIAGDVDSMRIPRSDRLSTVPERRLSDESANLDRSPGEVPGLGVGPVTGRASWSA